MTNENVKDRPPLTPTDCLWCGETRPEYHGARICRTCDGCAMEQRGEVG